MNSLVNYGSDDDYDDSSEEKQTDWRGTSAKDKQGSSGRQTDTNYEEVQMDLSEGSNDSKPDTKEPAHRSRDSRDRRERSSRDRTDDYRGRYERDRRGSRDKDGKYNHGRRDRDKERDRRSRERRRSRSPRRPERESRHSRSRSRSRDRARKYAKRYDRGAKSESAEKNDRQKAADEEKRTNTSENDRFFMPGITGRFRDQIERRKQLWQKKDVDVKDTKNGQSKKVWETTTFAQDTDGKVASKFKRLMGIRGNTEASGQGVDVLRKQEEMFSSMEQQYEVARTATHTMRGVGLGFGSFQR
ncbi:hypothetical protein Zmor_005291 [Zophobas morio]|uniref:Small acidic protein-like domain-containing protein n=1 Tax=Zophobas morio TaxID=2755281 RepID=A0AA38MM90_9CUCU|nr:hypothetical protein Zmor_005291 [Zophobas morio]